MLSSTGILRLSDGGAEISAFHAPSKLLLTIGGSSKLSVVDLSDPSVPALKETLGLDGVANSVAVSSTGLVAVALEGTGSARYSSGKVSFFKVDGVGSAATVSGLGSVSVGSVPDSIAFTPDGTRLVVACEGEPNELYTVDPEGTIAVVAIDATNPGASTVSTVGFSSLNGREAELRALGIRISGKPGTTAAQDLEPEYVSISSDGSKAYVTFQENNATGVVNLTGAAPSLVSLRSVGVQDYLRGRASVTTFDVTIPSPGTTTAGGVVPGGGLSGLYATGRDSQGRLTFLAPADRGPNGSGTTKDVVKADGTPGTDGTADPVVPFLLPDYQARFYKLALNEITGEVTVTGTVMLTRKDGVTPISGRSNGKGDQIPVDANGSLLPYDVYGADLESIVQDRDGNIWMSDEYRPAIYKFSASGVLIERYVPVGAAAAAGLTDGSLGVETLPAEYAKRQTNRGFEGMAYDSANNKLYAFVQSPLDDIGTNDGTKGSLVRILEVNSSDGQPTAEYLYPMAGKASASGVDSVIYENRVDKIGDAAYDSARQVFYVLERDSAVGAASFKQVFEVSLKGATNILENAVANEENISIDALKGQGITVASKVLLTNLSSEGYLPNDKPEGLALLQDGRIAVINDNDFGVTSLDAAGYAALSEQEKSRYSLASDINGSKTYVYAKASEARTQLGIVNTIPTVIDPSDRDGGIKPLANQNVYGLRMPDGIGVYQGKAVDGTVQTFTVIANEGDGRVRPDGSFTDPSTNTVIASESVYSDELRSGVTGTGTDNRLKIVRDQGNYDSSTPTYEQKVSFGGRSITILDSLNNVVWDSGDLIDRAAIAAGVYDDARSDDKGSEPENLAITSIGGRTYAFVGLERGTNSSIAAFDITDPYNGYLVDFRKSASGVVSPEGILSIPASQSPNGKDLVVVSNEVSKDVEILSFQPSYSLQILHYYGESGLLGIKTAPIMGALIDKFDDQFANTLVVGEGDSFIPGPWLVAGADASLAAVSSVGSPAMGRPDIAIMNLFGTNVSALGNHEFDLGSPVLNAAFAPSGAWKGAIFPFITSNLDFAGDSSLRGIADSSLGGTSTNSFAGKEASDIKAKIAPYSVVTKGGEKIGIVGATTWELLTKSSPNGTKVKDDGIETTSDLEEVANYLQGSVDALLAMGVNKIVMVDQLDSLERNKALAPLLRGVDVMVAGGGHERLGDANDKPVGFNGHDPNFISSDTYPILVNSKDGKPTLIVTSDTEYSYLGRLVVNFDSEGNVIPAALDNVLNGAYAATAETLKTVYGSGQPSEAIIAGSSIGSAVAQVTTALSNVITSKDSDVYGYTKVYLEGDRVFGRAQEVNLGNLTADANIYAAERALPSQTTWVSLKNGGGLRASIGSVDANGVKAAPVATDMKAAGAISKLEIENALRFDNKLMAFETTPAGLLNILNYAAGLTPGNGGFAQLGGVQFSYDPKKPAGSRVQDIALVDEGGRILNKIANDGVLLSDAPASISVVTLNFMANGGDGYPLKANGSNFRYLLQDGSLSAAVDPSLDFTAANVAPANALGEQQALQTYLQTFHGTPETAYARPDTPSKDDLRMQNLDVRPLDTVLIPTFGDGVASGDPYRDSVILWTRLNPQSTTSGSATVNWEVSTSKDFAAGTIADSGSFTTDASRDWTVKVEADGLKAGTSYYYRFSKDGVLSTVGQTRTLASEAFSTRIALFSCANFTAQPEFAIYGKAADINQQKPYDAWVHVGDYIYEYGKGGYSSAEGSANDRGFLPAREIVSLDDYRQRYAQYHTDVNLQNLRQNAPLIAIWDDHETANDSYKTGAENHQPASEGDWSTRVANAMKAYYEWMPIREPELRDGSDQGSANTPLTKAYRSFDFGDVLSLHMLETRLTARDQQLSYSSATSPAGIASIVNQAYNGDRAMIGTEQLNWLRSELASSKAAWQALGSGTLMANMAIPAELLLNASDPSVVAKYATPLQKLAQGLPLSPAEQALFNGASNIPYNLDAWDGYGSERQQIIEAALQLGKKLVSLSGDTHNAWASILDSARASDIAEQAFPSGSFLVETNDRSAFRPLITSGELANNGFRFNGTPDGVGVIDNGNTLRILVNHEFGASAGAVRSHGSKGAYVSDLVVDKATLAVISGGDFLKSASDLFLASPDGSSWSSGTTTAFARFCSGDLADPSAFRNGNTGYDGRIYLTGEEAGAEGRAFAHILSGAEAGRVYELPSLGNLSFENVVANPLPQTKTVAVALDDTSTNGQVYVYVGSKSASGNAVQQAGLHGGKLYGVKVGTGESASTEVGDLTKPTETGLALSSGQGLFSLVDLGDVSAKTGATINTESIAAGVTNFLRPEDGAWSLDGTSFFFATTASTSTASRLWALDFSDPSNPEAGGTIRLLLDGSEGQVMFDNLTVAKDGSILLQEDPGGNDRLAKIWRYDLTSDKLTEIAQHDPNLFSGANKITNDEESSGIVDITPFLANTTGYDTARFSYFVVADQIHKGVADPAEQVEMGQLSIMATANVKVLPQQAFPSASFLVGTENRSAFRPLITSGELANNGFRFNGTPDGVGVIDNGNTLRILVNHEFGASAGAVRSHGSKGAYVSDLVVDKATLAVISGGDFLKSASDLFLASPDGSSWSSGTTTAFARFCSGDLADPSAFRNGNTGYDGRIYLTGEEAGAEGRAFAHILSGAEAGRVYELPSLGNLSFENVVANPLPQTKTVAVALDDTSTNGQVYVYVGSKSASGNAVQQAGLHGGKLYGVKVGTGESASTEVGDLTKPTETGLALSSGQGLFSLVDLGDVSAKTGATINTESIAAGVTNFLRPEDGAWSLDGTSFFFATTASTSTASRLWALDFSDPSNPEAGGTIRLLLDGSEGQVMFDNLTVAKDGSILLQEDPGGNDRLAKIWRYDLTSDKLTEIAQHDPNLFSGANKITNDEESSGIVDITPFLANTTGYDTARFSYFVVADQIHKGVADPAEQVEMGQLSIMATPRVPITTGTVAGVEFGGPGVSSPGIESIFPGSAGLLEQLFKGYTKDLRYNDLEHRGFVDLTFTKDSITADYNLLTGTDPTTQQPQWSTETLYTDGSLTLTELKRQTGAVDFTATTDRSKPIILDVDSTQKQGRLYDEKLLPRSGDFKLRLTKGGFSADLPDDSKSKDVVQLEFQPGGGQQDVVISEQVKDEAGNLESIANAARGVITGTINNYIHTRDGDDEIIGSAGVDFIRAGAGRDIIDAGLGDDIVRSGSGSDQVKLGGGSDQLLITRDQLSGRDTLLDFSTEDRLVLADGINVIAGVGTNLLRIGDSSGNSQELLLAGTSVSTWSNALIRNV